jgi:deoxyribodipyrimidine photolyase-related protein
MTDKCAALVYPHQLWEANPAVSQAQTVFLIEDPLFFTQYAFHCQKLVLHRASMSEFESRCKELGKKVHRIESDQIKHSGEIGALIGKKKFKQVLAVDPTDTFLKKRVTEGCAQAGIEIQWLEDPAFLTSETVMERWAGDRDHYHFTDFYREQRKRLRILLDEKGKPVGGKLTFDTENRKKLPKGIVVPSLNKPAEAASVREAKRYVAKHFPSALGEVDEFCYPVTHQDAQSWLDDFVEVRLSLFGDYEDSIAKEHTYVFHGVLTPMLNIGLLTPQQVIDAVLVKANEVPLNSLEGFVRQVIGWREFIRMIYLHAGSQQRTRNSWQLSKKIPASFYTAQTGIVPVDDSIRRTLKYAYCHHIERLMVLGNFMLLCDIDPDEVYRWFMELFIDSYDWVMVPNVYGMSQHADGGLMTTKPYISGSSYVLKMSDYARGDWCQVWDALYWRFVDREREFFDSNPRMRVMVGQLTRMGAKLDQHRKVAEEFLETLHA